MVGTLALGWEVASLEVRQLETSAEDETDNDGEATFDVEIDDNAERGTYDVDIRVSKDGYDTKTVSTSFDVIGSGDDNDDNDDNNGSSSSAAASASSANRGSSSAVLQL